MTDGKKTDVPGAPLDDSVPAETPKLLQQDLGLDRRAPRPPPSFDHLTASPTPDLKATTPYFAVSAKLREAVSGEHPVGPEYANTVISDRKDPPSPLDHAKTQPSAANPVLAKQQADERAARERQIAERQAAERAAAEKASNEKRVADRAATGLRPSGLAPPRTLDPSLLTTDPVRQPPSPAALPPRPQPLRQPLASRPLGPASKDVITDPMPREAVPPATVVQRGPAPKTDPMQQPDVPGAMARPQGAAPLPPSRVAIPPPPPLASTSRPPGPMAATTPGVLPSRPPAPAERTEISRPAPMAPAPPASRPPAPAARTESSRPAPMAAAAPASRPPSPMAPAPPASRPPAPVERTEISRPAPMAAAPPASRPPSPMAAALPASRPPAPVERTEISRPAPIASAPPGVPMPAPMASAPPGVPMPARLAAPAGPVIDAAPTLKPPQGPQVTPTPAKQIGPQDLTPDVPREAVPAVPRAATPAPQRARVTPPARPALVVPPSYLDLPPAMEQPRRLGPEFATTQPGVPGPYSKQKPAPAPAPLPELAPVTTESAAVPLGQEPSDTFSDRPALKTASDEPIASDQVLAAPASLWRRALAMIFDLGALGGAVAGLLLLALSLIGKPPPEHLQGIDAFVFQLQPIALPALALAVLLALLYTTLGAFLLKGRTLGRLLVGIRLVDSSGQSPGAIRSLLRAAFAIVSFALFLAGFWLAVFDRRGQTLHDKLTRTFVVRPV